MATNPFAPLIPCHRVVMSDGRVGGYSQGAERKIELLEKEGVKIKNNEILNFKKFLFNDFKVDKTDA